MKHWQSTLALAALMIGLFGWLVTDIRELRSEVRADIGTLRADISTLRGDVTALRERMARMEALILRGATAEEARAPGDQPDRSFQNTGIAGERLWYLCAPDCDPCALLVTSA